MYYAFSGPLSIAGPYGDLHRLCEDVVRHYPEKLPATIVDGQGILVKTLPVLKPPSYHDHGSPIVVEITEHQFFKPTYFGTGRIRE